MCAYGLVSVCGCIFYARWICAILTMKVGRSAGRGEVRVEGGNGLNLKETGSFLSVAHGTETPLCCLRAPYSPCLRSGRNSIRT